MKKKKFFKVFVSTTYEIEAKNECWAIKFAIEKMKEDMDESTSDYVPMFDFEIKKED